MFHKLGQAAKLFASNAGLLAALTLTILLPVNTLAELAAFSSPTEVEAASRYMRIQSVCGGAFGPIGLGAALFALDRIHAGQKVSYLQALGQGFRRWGRLLAAQLLMGLHILVASIFFIEPGLVLAVRYFLVVPVAVLEGGGGEGALRKSAELTKGRRWSIFGAGAIFFITYLILNSVLFAIQDSCGWSDVFAVQVASDCISDVLFVYLAVLAFAYYVDGRQPMPDAVPLAQPVATTPAARSLPEESPGSDLAWPRCPNPECGQMNPPGAKFCARCGCRT